MDQAGVIRTAAAEQAASRFLTYEQAEAPALLIPYRSRPLCGARRCAVTICGGKRKERSVSRIRYSTLSLFSLLVACVIVFSASRLTAQADSYAILNVGPTDYLLDSAGSTSYFSAQRVYYSDGVVGMQGTYVSASNQRLAVAVDHDGRLWLGSDLSVWSDVAYDAITLHRVQQTSEAVLRDGLVVQVTVGSSSASQALYAGGPENPSVRSKERLVGDFGLNAANFNAGVASRPLVADFVSFAKRNAQRHPQRGKTTQNFQSDLACAAAGAALLVSYVDLFAYCGTPVVVAVVPCLIAVGAHAAAVTGFVAACF
jgi:hypothetical protein